MLYVDLYPRCDLSIQMMRGHPTTHRTQELDCSWEKKNRILSLKARFSCDYV